MSSTPVSGVATKMTFTPMRCIDITEQINAHRRRKDTRPVEIGYLLAKGLTHVQFGTYVARIARDGNGVESIENYQQGVT